MDVTYSLVFLRIQVAQDVVVLLFIIIKPSIMITDLLQDVDGHAEVVVLHGGGGVDASKRGGDVDHELVVETSGNSLHLSVMKKKLKQIYCSQS